MKKLEEVVTQESIETLNRQFAIYGFPLEDFSSVIMELPHYGKFLCDKVDLLVDRIVDDIRNVTNPHCIAILYQSYKSVIGILWDLRLCLPVEVYPSLDGLSVGDDLPR